MTRLRRAFFEALEPRTLLAIDFGDAPDTGPGSGTGNYETLLIDNGARHIIDSTQAALFLGQRVDAETDASAGSKANGDDIIGLPTSFPDDEDGLLEPAQDLLLTVGSAPVVRVRATNTTGAAATLYGWIDSNRDGVFDNATERASVAVPTGTNNGTVNLSFPTIPAGTAAGSTYARFRLSSDPAAANAIGSASGGEVEDYSATILLRSDGTADGAKSKKIASGTSGGPTLTNGDYFGSAVASLGDLDGDGVTDMAVGAALDDTNGTNGPFSNRGAVYIQFMNANGTVKSSVKLASGTNGGPTLADRNYFGSSLASLGDVDGDGVIDLAVGARGDSTGGPARGAVHLLKLNANGTVKSSVKLASGTNGGPTLSNGDYFGASVVSLGDVDGDGVGDLAVGAANDNSVTFEGGAVHVLLLNASGTVKSRVKIASGVNGGPLLSSSERFGSSMASLGDLDGDGVTDLAVGAFGNFLGGPFRGAVHVLLMKADGTVKSKTLIASGVGGLPFLANGDRFGASVASVGDLDGDGVSDLAVGAVGDKTGGQYRGAVHVLMMNANGTVKSSVKLASGTNGVPTLSDIDTFGSSVASLGDLDGDGLADLAVGAFGDNTGGADRGSVHLLFLKAFVPPVTDFGDAPDTSAGTGAGNYQTLLAHNGPRHVITTTQTTLFLGSNVDAEADASQNARASGDDRQLTPALDDEDGLLEPAQDLLLTVGSAPVVRVRATNTTGAPATLYGWIDYNRDGVFDNTTERASILVPNATNKGTFTLTFPVIPADTAAGSTYARFRLSSDAAAASATGSASGGEVEDYAATITRRSDGTADSQKSRKIASGTSGGPVLADDDLFGGSVAPLGDLNGDGVVDLAVGAPTDDTGGTDRGAVYVQFMNANGTVKSSVKIASGTGGGPVLANGDFFGSAVASLGDLDGDGVTDLAVGARGDGTGGLNRGAVHILFLNANGTVKSSAKIASGTGGGPALADGDYFGRSLVSIGDLDGDGIVDLAVGANRDDTGGANRGAVHTLLLNSDGTAKSSVKIASGTSGAPPLADGDYFGRSIASLGDLDGDGVTDLAVGAFGDDTGGSNRGAVHVLLLNANGSVKSSAKIANNTGGGPVLANLDQFSNSVASLGDLDGDGVTDLAVGAFGDDTGGPDRGAIHVLLLNPNGTVKSSVKIASGGSGGPALADGDSFGTSVASLGDLDGDGVADLAIGAYRDDTNGTSGANSNRGAVHVLFLNLFNRAPTRTGALANLASIAEDALNPTGSTVASLFGSLFADADGTTIATGGVALIANAATAAQGTWQVQIGAGTFIDLPALTDPQAVIVLGASDLIRFMPAANYNGAVGSLTARLWDGTRGFVASATVQNISVSLGGNGAFSDDANKVTLNTNVTEVNDAPNAVDNVLTNLAEDSGPRTIFAPTLLGNDFVGPANELGQSLTITQVGDAVGGTVSIVGSSVVFSPTPNYHGPASFTYTVRDSGTTNGTADFKTDTATVSFTITEVNDPPTAAADALPSVAEDSGAKAIALAALLANDSSGPADESGQTLSITQVGSAVGGTVSIVGTDVIFTPAPDFNGPASFSYTLQDNGITSGAADFKTSTATVSFTITEVNDAPTGVGDSLAGIPKNAPPRTIGWAALLSNDSRGPANESAQTLKITQVGGAVGGAVSVVGTDVIFSPEADFRGQASFTYTLQDDGTTSGAPDFKTSTALVSFVIDAINQAPTFAFAAGPSPSASDEDSAQTISTWATGISAGPPEESAQALTFEVLVPAEQQSLFSVQPAIDSSGTLTYTPRANAAGSAMVSVVLRDSGGTANGGSDASTPQTFKITITKPHPWYNASTLAAPKIGALDVDANGSISPFDAVLVINYLNSGQPTAVPAGAPIGGPAGIGQDKTSFLDTGGADDGKGNNTISPFDAVLVINWLNANPVIPPGPTALSAEGEAPSDQSEPDILVAPGEMSADLTNLIALLALDTAAQPKRRRW